MEKGQGCYGLAFLISSVPGTANEIISQSENFSNLTHG